jgi:hypothetical protein
MREKCFFMVQSYFVNVKDCAIMLEGFELSYLFREITDFLLLFTEKNQFD